MTERADVVVVGGGIVGAASAYELARRGLQVVLLEAERLGYGASGRNLGYVWSHTRRPGPELALVDDTRRRLPELEEELGARFGLRQNGSLIFVTTDAQAVVLREFVAQRRSDGLPVELLDSVAARAMAPILPETVTAASYCPWDAQVEPEAYVRAFGLAAQRHGARLREGVAVRSLRAGEGRVTGVETDVGPIEAEWTVVAAGGWTPSLVRQLGLELPILPMRLQVMQTEPMPPRLEHLLYGPVAVKQYSAFQELPSFRPELFASAAEERHGQLLLEAACQKDDGSYVLGCAMDYPGFEWRPDVRGVALISEVLLADLPELRAARFARAWAGILPYTPDNLPIIDGLPGWQGVIVAAGHVFGNGAGPTTGRLVAGRICGEGTPLDPVPYLAGRAGLGMTAASSVW
ncbi:MAG TPA: FAD-binding oxidoreductase [Candidatus Limnocylindrales bacterium]|nr:FAD-binding oxidoreductase [Candidatus Limnocylindrales bacterium]